MKAWARCVVFGLIVLAGCAHGAAPRLDLRADLTAGKRIEIAGENIEAGALDTVYRQRGYAPFWVDATGRPSAAGKILISRLEAAGSQGLEPEHYRIKAIHDDLAAHSKKEATALELLLSHELRHYATDLGAGRLEPGQVAQTLAAFHREIAGVDVVARAFAAPDLSVFLDSLAPASPSYRALQQALVRYQAMASWPSLPDGPALKLGMRDARLPALRRRLRASGDLAAAADSGPYDETLEAAVARFQARVGLPADGVVGQATREALNVPREKRIAQIVLNLERLRWFPDDLGPRFVRVNIAAFAMDLVEEGKTVLTMRVVAGRPYRRTPVFVSRIESVVLNPTWTVPPSIAATDILRHIRSDPGYLTRHHFTVFSSWAADAKTLDPAAINWSKLGPGRFPYRLRQASGPDNALGRYKFVFPNDFGVYLHDTPARELFARDQRAFSSGCVRLENARALAERLLAEDAGWSPEALSEAVDTGRRQSLPLARPVPIMVLYGTAWVGADGSVQFRPDIYGRDARLAAALETLEESQAPPYKTQ